MSVCQISNFSYITPNVAIKDVARILDRDPKRMEKYGRQIGTKKAFEIAKLFNNEKWEDCIVANKSSIEKYSDDIYTDLFRIAKAMSGRVRHVSIHAGGVGIVGTKISDYMPMRLTDKNEQVIQVDKKIIEDIGIVKFDLLGLGNLGIIQDTLNIAGIDHWEIDPNNENFLNDKEAYDLISSGDTASVFQLESKGMRNLCQQLKPKCVEDISDIIALFRPDVIQAGMLDDYVDRKVNGTKIEYIHPDMEKILGRTYGVQIYQEQSMEITRVFGGRSYSGADTLRKLIAKKQVEKVKPEIAKLRQEIIDNGYTKEVSDSICDVMEGFGNYSFNKSHSIGYSIIALQTAYLKAHYPVAFYCAVLNSCDNDNGKINKYISECDIHNVKVLPPRINESNSKFSVVDGKILFGLNAINSVGSILVEKIVDERNEHGLYTSIPNLMERVSDLNTAQIVSLIKSGCFGENKEELIKSFLKWTVNQKVTDEYKEYKPVKTLPSLLVLKTEYGIDTDVIKDKQERLDLYNAARKKLHETVEHEQWKEKQKLKKKSMYHELIDKYAGDKEYWEFESISTFLTDNPFKDVYQHIKRPFSVVEEDQEFFDIGIISKITKKKDKYKRTYCFFNLYSFSGIIEGVCFASTYDNLNSLITKGNKVAVFGKKNSEDTFVVQDIETIENWMKRVGLTNGHQS